MAFGWFRSLGLLDCRLVTIRCLTKGAEAEQYDKLKTVNMETASRRFMTYKNISAHFAGKTKDAVAGSGVLCVPVWANEIFANVKPGDGETAVGYMNSAEPRSRDFPRRRH